MALDIFLLFILFLFNGVFAMSELAIASSRKTRLQQWADEGDDRAAVALRLAEHPNRFLATVQIGITLIGIVTGFYGGASSGSSPTSHCSSGNWCRSAWHCKIRSGSPWRSPSP